MASNKESVTSRRRRSTEPGLVPPSRRRVTSAFGPTPPSGPEWRGLYATVFALWTVFGVVEGSQYYFIRSVGPQPVTWEHAFRVSVPRMWVWALLTPPIVAYARRVGQRWTVRFLVAHLLGAVGFSTLGLTVGAGVYYGTANEAGTPFGRLLPAYFAAHSAVAVIAYLAIVGGFHAYAYYGRFRQRDLEAAELRARASALEARLSESRLRLLKQQLQPHFLFNTLHAVSTLVLKGQPERAIRMISRLSGFLRLSLDQAPDQEVTLGQELEALDRYLAIQELRFEDRLRIERHVQPATLEALVPSLLLQPLAENAVRYGVERNNGTGLVQIRVERIDGELRIRIDDGGPGFSDDSAPRREGIGLRNTRERLAALYGSDARLRCLNRKDGGGRVEVSLPYRLGRERASRDEMHDGGAP